GDKSLSSERPRFVDVVLFTRSGVDNDRNSGEMGQFPQLDEKLFATHSGHLQVQEDDVGYASSGISLQRQGFKSATGNGTLYSRIQIPQGERKDLLVVIIVLDQETSLCDHTLLL